MLRSVELDRERIARLTQEEHERLNAATGGSAELYRRANRVLSGGVASSYQVRDPWPLYLERGEGPKVWDVDGRELWDFHNGFGSMVQGHAHPAIGAAIRARYDLGTHFAAPTEDAVVVGEELARRFRLPKWRYTNSGLHRRANRDGNPRQLTSEAPASRSCKQPGCSNGLPEHTHGNRSYCDEHRTPAARTRRHRQQQRT